MCHLRRSVLGLSLLLLAGCNCLGGGGAGGSSATAAGAAAGGDAKAEVIAVHDQYRKALLEKDLVTLDRIWSDDLTFINYRGDLLTKKQRMENVRTGATSLKAVQVGDQTVRVLGDSAVLTALVTLEGQYSGQEGSGTYRATSVYTRQGGQWRISALQMTKVEK